MTPAAVLLLVCTFAYPQGGVAEAIQAPSCPKHDLGNDSSLSNDGTGTRPCVRRFKL